MYKHKPFPNFTKMPQSIISAIPKRSYRKEAIVALAAVGIAIVVWNWKDKISGFWNYLGFSCSTKPGSILEKSSSEVSKSAPEAFESTSAKSADASPESATEPTSAANTEKPVIVVQSQKEVIGNSAPESTEKLINSVYVGLPKANPATVSNAIQPPNWPGATPR